MHNSFCCCFLLLILCTIIKILIKFKFSFLSFVLCCVSTFFLIFFFRFICTLKLSFQLLVVVVVVAVMLLNEDFPVVVVTDSGRGLVLYFCLQICICFLTEGMRVEEEEYM